MRTVTIQMNRGVPLNNKYQRKYNNYPIDSTQINSLRKVLL